VLDGILGEEIRNSCLCWEVFDELEKEK
jgi:hypothetical protein